ncbi:DUF3021 domain-containing protein [uncultured Methanobrevibacter sp.]|uniref:DUF3021 domain-containing protein n=1 Tax=uncultured Methanobrevibacter sp. TaxID=253161 RepID=UPI00262AB029|nr:DUF3021 domain-containing protein [uncultured Methanobrevibacter sp.]
MKVNLIRRLAMGAFIGCFMVMLVMVVGSFSYGPSNVQFSGTEIINAFFGSIVVGWVFSLTGLIYEKDEIAFPLQIIFQMGIGMTALFIVAIYLKWMPINLGWEPVITWVAIACIFASVSWLGFYIYYYLLARELNNKLNN